MTEEAVRDRQALDIQVLLRRETIAGAIMSALASIGLFVLVFGWAPVETQSLAIDFLPQAFGVTFLGGLVPSLIMLARVRNGTIVPTGVVPAPAMHILRLLGYALLAMPVLGGSAALLMMSFGPPVFQLLPALVIKALFGGFIGLITTPPILRKALSMSFFSGPMRGSPMG